MDHTLLINAMPWHWLLTLVLATLVQFHVGGTFYRSAWSGLKHGSANMSGEWGLQGQRMEIKSHLTNGPPYC